MQSKIYKELRAREKGDKREFFIAVLLSIVFVGYFGLHIASYLIK